MTILTKQQVTNYAAQAGFTGQALNIAVAIAQAESSFNTQAKLVNVGGSIDRGLYQINNVYHPEVSDTQAYNPLSASQAAYNISSRGTNFGPWVTYTTGAYQKYLTTNTPAQGNVPSTAATVKSGTANNFPKGQCTWWADMRYQQLTGHYIPWGGDAHSWAANAKASNWTVSALPTAPSIIVLQPGTQGADYPYGHVAVVERINANGTVYTSDYNWNGNTTSVSYVNFKPGAGVSFVNYPNALDSISLGTPGSTPGTVPNVNIAGDVGSLFNTLGSLFGIGGYVAPMPTVLDQVHETLISNPGFYGIALAIDEAEQFPGYEDLSSGPFDTVGIIRSVGNSISDNALPFAIRSGLILIGVTIIILLIAKVALGVGEKVGPLVAALA